MTARLQHTKKYDLFELCYFNRDVKKTKQLEKSMKEHGYIQAYPLHCVKNGSGQLQIKAGHHRFVVAKMLLLEIWYVVCDDDASIHELEAASQNWTPADYLTSHVRDGRDSYEVVREYHERTGIPLQHCIALCAGETCQSSNQTAKFKAGNYVVAEDDTHRKALADLLDHCAECGVKFAKKTLFVQAVSRCLRAPEFDPKVFKQRVATNPGLLVKQPTVDTTMTMIEMVYNHHAVASNRIALKFVVDRAMQERSASYRKQQEAKKTLGSKS